MILMLIWIVTVVFVWSSYVRAQEEQSITLPPPQQGKIIPDPLFPNLTPEQKRQIKDAWERPETVTGGRQLTEEEIQQEIKAREFACPGREETVSSEDVEEARKRGAKKPEAWACAMKGTWLWRHNGPDYQADPDLIDLYLRKGKYEKMADSLYEEEAKAAERRWPQQRYAHELSYQMLAEKPGRTKEALEALKKAAYLGLEAGYVIFYQNQMSQMTVQALDPKAADEFFNAALAKATDGYQRAQTLANYGETVAAWDPKRAGELLQAAVNEVQEPEKKEEFLHRHIRFLMDRGQY
ncbi:MAG: hypothetical protein ACRERD_06530 [Candidatus Binatia bacterium]